MYYVVLGTKYGFMRKENHYNMILFTFYIVSQLFQYCDGKKTTFLCVLQCLRSTLIMTANHYTFSSLWRFLWNHRRQRRSCTPSLPSIPRSQTEGDEESLFFFRDGATQWGQRSPGRHFIFKDIINQTGSSQLPIDLSPQEVYIQHIWSINDHYKTITAGNVFSSAALFQTVFIKSCSNIQLRVLVDVCRHATINVLWRLAALLYTDCVWSYEESILWQKIKVSLLFPAAGGRRAQTGCNF